MLRCRTSNSLDLNKRRQQDDADDAALVRDFARRETTAGAVEWRRQHELNGFIKASLHDAVEEARALGIAPLVEETRNGSTAVGESGLAEDDE